jgi:hypothetical protein
MVNKLEVILGQIEGQETKKKSTKTILSSIIFLVIF